MANKTETIERELSYTVGEKTFLDCLLEGGVRGKRFIRSPDAGCYHLVLDFHTGKEIGKEPSDSFYVSTNLIQPDLKIKEVRTETEGIVNYLALEQLMDYQEVVSE